MSEDAVNTATTTTTAAAAATNDDDWPAKATQTLVGYVDTVRSATTGKALVASRALVYFLAAGLIAAMLLVLVLVLVIRLLVSLTAYLSFIDSGQVWLAYLILSAIFLAAGMIAWRKKEA